MQLRTCVDPCGKFIVGRHRPRFVAANLRENDCVGPLGCFEDGTAVDNQANFPAHDVDEPGAGVIYEILNPFPFRGVTYIAEGWAAEKAKNPSAIRLAPPPELSFGATLEKWDGAQFLSREKKKLMFESLPAPLQLAVAQTSTDALDLICLADISCEFIFDAATGRPSGLRYAKDARGRIRPVIRDNALYEVIANNPALPDDYKQVMVLIPGVQGNSEIVGEWSDLAEGGQTHVFEYLRRNSYIPWGHYAANMAHDAVRYRVGELSETDMHALRHLYYQRTFVRLARSLEIPVDCHRRGLSPEALENLRREILIALKNSQKREMLLFNRSLWGWNFGFDYAPTRYRLHASHQQIHQQYAMVPKGVESLASAGTMAGGGENGNAAAMISSYACGDLIADFVRRYRQETGKDFFDTYMAAIRANQRMDGASGPNRLVVYEDSDVMVVVPKAQTSQWELQMMTRQPVGNVLEADLNTRAAIDAAILLAVGVLEKLGARMITTIEYSKAFDAAPDLADQRLVYSFLPRLPQSPGAFSEAQLRWINGHYPEDFAAACRAAV